MGRGRKKTSGAIDEQAIDHLADLVVKSFELEQDQALEPFDVYVARVRSKVHADLTEFHRRFHHGYHVLLDELAKHKGY